MKRIVVTLGLAASLTSCHFIPGTKAHEIAEAQLAVRQILVDPDAAQFRNDHVVAAYGAVCGEVNPKNRMGGYAGFVPYAYLTGQKTAYIRPDPDGTDKTAMDIAGFPVARPPLAK